ncbi:vancomycin resistance protein YoaR [Melghirimyces profundicolus]|uniref:Vancomycin resistance protein YoaR n=1 Tax=Melghirimyces profundicolus TaxID=1242148 RepID=A0A2T6C2C3_9BACL|nr:VanW family protein [Melghirimyces profundicolus]PTX62474.1 vancomycin resistance protein YoaR [Melghirimyces profundicolus]
MKDYHSVLGVSPESSQEEIKRAYRRLVRQYHPDVNPSPEAERQFREVREAYEALSARPCFPLPEGGNDGTAKDQGTGKEKAEPPSPEPSPPQDNSYGEPPEDEPGEAFGETDSEDTEEESGISEEPSGKARRDPVTGSRADTRRQPGGEGWKWAFTVFILFLLFVISTRIADGFFQDPNRLILEHRHQKWEIDLNQIGYDGENPDSINRKQLDAWLAKVRREVDRPPRNARIKHLGDPIRPAKNGKVMDVDAVHRTLENLPAILNKPQPIPMKKAAPLVVERDLLRVDRKRISSYTTYFKGANRERIHNIRKSANALDGRVLNPGEVFSFNREVGKRSRERGYLPVPSRVKGEFSEGVGGGVSQTSSTLFNSVDEAGMEIIYRFSYGNGATYVPSGRDATVAWDAPDFQFKNSLKEPVLIRVNTDDRSITVELYSTPEAEVSPRSVPPAPKGLPVDVPTDPESPSDRLDPGQEGSNDQGPTGTGTGGQSGGATGSTGETDTSSTGGADTSGDGAGGSTGGEETETGGDTSDTGDSTGNDADGGDTGEDNGNDTDGDTGNAEGGDSDEGDSSPGDDSSTSDPSASSSTVEGGDGGSSVAGS